MVMLSCLNDIKHNGLLPFNTERQTLKYRNFFGSRAPRRRKTMDKLFFLILLLSASPVFSGYMRNVKKVAK